MLAEIRDSLRRVSEREVTALEREIARSRSVFTTAAGRTLILMRPFAMRLMQYGFNSCVVGDTTTPRLGKGDLLLVASGRGNTPGVVRRAEEARAAGGRVFSITTSRESPLMKSTSAAIVIPPPRDGSFQFGYVWFEQAMFVLLECVAYRLAKRRKITLQKLMERHANLE